MSKWGGRQAMNARAQWLPRILAGDIRCCRCGRPIRHDPSTRGGGWDVDHYPISREHGGTQTWPAHANQCNRRAGGKRGAQLTNARKGRGRNTLRIPESERGIIGL